ncbi:hypothetical protein PWT90_03470 [Aphanocladium album]|nr:hypothetical protein PWT90_03470 [Aphanocladium album]
MNSDAAEQAFQIDRLKLMVKKDLEEAVEEFAVAGADDLVYQQLLPQHSDVLVLKYTSPHGVIDQEIMKLLKSCQALYLLNPRGKQARENATGITDPSAPRLKEEDTAAEIKPQPIDLATPEATADGSPQEHQNETEHPLPCHHDSDDAELRESAHGDRKDDGSAVAVASKASSEATEIRKDSDTSLTTGSKRSASEARALSDRGEKVPKRPKMADTIIILED